MQLSSGMWTVSLGEICACLRAHLRHKSLAALAAVDSACASSSDSRVMAASGPTTCVDVVAGLPFFLDKIAEFLGRGCPVLANLSHACHMAARD